VFVVEVFSNDLYDMLRNIIFLYYNCDGAHGRHLVGCHQTHGILTGLASMYKCPRSFALSSSCSLVFYCLSANTIMLFLRPLFGAVTITLLLYFACILL
jgi:hypothetical protein